MDKQESMDILNECLEWLEHASSEQVQMMQKVYNEAIFEETEEGEI